VIWDPEFRYNDKFKIYRSFRKIADDKNDKIRLKFKMAMKELSDHKLVPTQDNNFKSLSKEINAFEASRKKTENKKWSSDKSIDDLCFLKGFFE
jgi:hypothetical protein